MSQPLQVVNTDVSDVPKAAEKKPPGWQYWLYSQQRKVGAPQAQPSVTLAILEEALEILSMSVSCRSSLHFSSSCSLVAPHKEQVWLTVGNIVGHDQQESEQPELPYSICISLPFWPPPFTDPSTRWASARHFHHSLCFHCPSSLVLSGTAPPLASASSVTQPHPKSLFWKHLGPLLCWSHSYLLACPHMGCTSLYGRPIPQN